MKGLIIHFEVAGGRQADFEAAMAFHIGNVRTRDPSYTHYSLAKIVDSATRYVLTQQFESMETQARHQQFDYVLAAMPAIDACLAGPPTLEWLDVIL